MLCNSGRMGLKFILDQWTILKFTPALKGQWMTNQQRVFSHLLDYKGISGIKIGPHTWPV